MKIGDKTFNIGEKTYIMGILNVTPDSFSDGGSYTDITKAAAHAIKMQQDGADIIDIGGESTRPNHTPVEELEELDRVIPVIRELKGRGLTISIDTYKAKVAEVAIKNGAALVNDVWGFKKDPKIASVVAKHGVACCLMHNRDNHDYHDLINDIISDLQESIDIALKAGVSRDKIILDVGIGFGKTPEQNLEVLNNLEKFKALGYPLLLGTSRKSTIGYVLDLPADQRVEGTLATTAIGIAKGCDFVRVHDIRENVRVAKMTDAITRR